MMEQAQRRDASVRCLRQARRPTGPSLRAGGFPLTRGSTVSSRFRGYPALADIKKRCLRPPSILQRIAALPSPTG
jgi:hypothetical protein